MKAFTFTIKENEIGEAIRKGWGTFSPVERVVKSKKQYNRNKTKQQDKRSWKYDY